MFITWCVNKSEYSEDDIIVGLDKDKEESDELSGLTSDLDLALQGFGDEPTTGSDDQLK